MGQQTSFPQLKENGQRPEPHEEPRAKRREPEKPAKPLTRDDSTRFSRHLLLPGVGLRGQNRLQSARVMVIGLGSAGTPAASYLASAGVGQLGLLDDDTIELANLQGQVLFENGDIGKPKLEVAGRRLKNLSPNLKIEQFATMLRASNALELVRGYDLVIDGTNSTASHYLINDACMITERPFIFAHVSRYSGHLGFFPPGGPCYRCLFPKPPSVFNAQTAEEEGLLAALPGLMGTLAATEALKYFLESGRMLRGRILTWDTLHGEFKSVPFQREPACPACSKNKKLEILAADDQAMKTPLTAPAGVQSIEPRALNAKMKAGRFFLLLDVRSKSEYDLCHIKGAHHIPLLQLQQRLGELSRQTEIVVYCKNGAKSRLAIEILKKAGFKKLLHLRGGMLAWIEQVEPSLPKY
ncbi:MAG TPA: ThiF family adenylyltransferase [Bdellovibrionales bacterium]|nr:ThiF family adenylyltransferase [Bdellovibrionales bacterium]